MAIEIEFDREEDGRWIAEAVDLPGVLAYGSTQKEAAAAAEALARSVMDEREARK
jgi:predicted RNase H-like HicB family nuclease